MTDDERLVADALAERRTVRTRRAAVEMIDEAYVAAAAQVLGLVLEPAELAAVLENLQRIEALAQPVLGAVLAAGEETGPVWTP